MTTTLWVLYASATGNAEEIAKRIHEYCLTKKYPSNLTTLNDFKDKILSKRKPSDDAFNMIIVASTTGNGDVPENGDKFWRFIKRATQPTNFFSGIKYGVLGLGDTNYDRFCFASKQIDKRINELGGEKVCMTGNADDATGLEEVVEPWIDQLKIQLDRLYPSKQPQIVQEQEIEPCLDEQGDQLSSTCFVKVKLIPNDTAISPFQPIYARPISPSTPITPTIPQISQRLFDYHSPFMSKIVGARYLTTSGAEKQVLHVELDITNSGITYAPGDAIAIIPENDPEMVDQLLRRLQIYEDRDSFVKTECTDPKKLSLYPKHLELRCNSTKDVTLRELFTSYIDITSTVSTSVLRMLAEHCSDRQERQDLIMLATPSINPTGYRVYVQQQSANLLDLLLRYPSCQPPLNKVLQLSQPMRPRYYSITSSPLRYPNTIHIAFTLIKYETPPPYRLEKYGCCTRWLAKRTQDFLTKDEKVYIPIFLKAAPEFRLPQDINSPMIMIGPGTGVAPFRSFLQHRECILNAQIDRDTVTSQDWRGKNIHNRTNWLFYGCRRRDIDFLYRQDLRNFETQSPVELNLLVASSREADTSTGMWYGGMYVQDYLKEYSGTILSLMNKHGGYLYVCGDAHGMAKDVHRVLRGLIEEELGLNREQAESCMLEWEKNGRYQRDVW